MTKTETIQFWFPELNRAQVKLFKELIHLNVDKALKEQKQHFVSITHDACTDNELSGPDYRAIMESVVKQLEVL